MATAEVEIPKKYKAAVYDKPGTVSTKIEELETPEPGAGEILINLYAAAPFPASQRRLTSLREQNPLWRLPLRFRSHDQ